MDRITTVEARDRLDDLVDCAADDGRRIILTRDGKELAALVLVEDAWYLQMLEDQLDNEAADAALAEVAEKGTVPWEQIEARPDR